MRLLNLCLHNIISDGAKLSSPYELKVEQLRKVIETAEVGKVQGSYDDFVLYFDDSYESFSSTVVTLDFLSHIPKTNIRVAVIVEKLGRPGYMRQEDVVRMNAEGYRIGSHGYSHAALAVFDDGSLQDTPSEGQYKAVPYGQGEPLTVNEIRYQIIESKKFLEDLIKAPVEEFILPYGLYNKTVIDLIQKSGLYKKALTCHTALDLGDFLAPRHLVTQDNLNTIGDTLFNLPGISQLLYKK